MLSCYICQTTYISELLYDLDGIIQSPRYHPEKDALHHSLQVFQCAYNQTTDPELLAVALLHDLGKAIDIPNHAQIGANLLQGVVTDRICWLVLHHLDLLIAPRRTRKKYQGQNRLHDLENLRRWDLAGRDPSAAAPTVEQALDLLTPHFPSIFCGESRQT